MVKKYYLILAAAVGITLASCTSEEPLVVNHIQVAEDVRDSVGIVFGSLSKGMTRADFVGKEAADKLGNKFVVSGKKGSASASTNGSIVFDNYLVVYEENTAHTTESNSCNWEYDGKGLIQHAADHGITSQKIKYWDYSAPQYDFIAWSTGSKTAIYTDPGTIPAGSVYVSAINPNATGTAAVTFKGAAADLQECYISDLTTVKKAQYGDDPVNMTFRCLGSKVRIAIYETVPGYSVRDVKFYTAADVALADNATDDTPRLFSTAANNIYRNGTYTVTYPTTDNPSNPDNNLAHVAFSGTGTQSTMVEFGSLNLTIAEEGERTPGSVYIGRTSNTASYAGEAEGNYYTAYLPNEAGTNLNLRVNFTLESTDGGGETIVVKGATAQVPSIYTQWKAGYAYTYIFKISDKTNGYTGAYDPTKPDDTTVNSDPAGLYPITFDALVVNADDNDKTQETITTVSTPSITTYQKGSTVINNDEYLAATGDIFVTVNDGNAATTPDLANGQLQDLVGKAKLYKLPAGKYTEADVVDAMQTQDDDAATGTVKGRSGLVMTEKPLTLTNTIQYGVDGNAIEIPVDGTKKKAARFTPEAGTYAFVYTKTAPTTTNEMFQPVTKAVGASVSGLYRYALVAAPAGDMQKGVTYFPNSAANADAVTAFVGQGVGNLYLDAAGTTIASGYAVTGTTYYYTTNHGVTYKAAYNVPYASFASATDLYTFDGADYHLKTDLTPVDGTAYYHKEGTEYTYCVILPRQTTGLYVIDDVAAKVACGTSDTAVKGMTYFDKYAQNNGVYYTKVIKVQ
ncbi:MAG: hypothetical protein K6G92_02850 [Bacteroidaceae bacterium]|nr:hypothetical protein [Bacteroidaceae bacterium]